MSDIDTAVADSLKVLDLKRPIREADIGSAFVQHQPTLGHRAIETSLVFRRRALELIEEGRVDLLDIDPAILDRLECVGELDQLARSGFGIGEGAVGNVLHAASDR